MPKLWREFKFCEVFKKLIKLYNLSYSEVIYEFSIIVNTSVY